MEKTELKKEPDGKLTLFTMGLRLEVQPYWLLKQMINKNSQEILDKIIEAEFRKVLKNFSKWYHKMIESQTEDDNSDEIFRRYKYTEHVKEIQDVADFSRNLLSLHSDWEYVINKDENEDEKEAVEQAYEFWHYNSFYGFEPLSK
ncbi:MAG: hypothetical protein AABY15_02075 [Nanoarchaeota archaeon]